MTWYDVIAVLLIALIIWLESHRGFGRALFDFIGAVIALKVSGYVAGPLAESVPLAESRGTTEAIWMVGVFVVLVALVVIGSRFLYETTLLSLDVFDPLVGGLLGAASGMLLAHVFLKMLLLSYGESEVAKVLLGSFVGQELLKFRTFHIVLNTLSNLGKW